MTKKDDNKKGTLLPAGTDMLLAAVRQVAAQHTGDEPEDWSVESGTDGFRAMRRLSGSYTLVELESICRQIRTVQERVAEITGAHSDTDERREYVRLAPRVGVDPAWYGRTFRSVQSGREFRVVGIKLGRSRYPVLCERVPDRKRFKFPVASVAEAFAKVTERPSERATRLAKANVTLLSDIFPGGKR